MQGSSDTANATYPFRDGTHISDQGPYSVTPAVPRRTTAPKQRKYLPTFSDLIDRLTITQLKAIFIPEHREEYVKEMGLIEHDLDLLIEEREIKFDAESLRAIMLVMLTNRYIWENEAKARNGDNGQDKLLKLTHSINGVRNTAKNVLAKAMGERLDYKVDCFAAELVKDFGDWQVYPNGD